jgi:hypothetical protein
MVNKFLVRNFYKYVRNLAISNLAVNLFNRNNKQRRL